MMDRASAALALYPRNPPDVATATLPGELRAAVRGVDGRRVRTWVDATRNYRDSLYGSGSGELRRIFESMFDRYGTLKLF
jgi:hypothetical protein